MLVRSQTTWFLLAAIATAAVVWSLTRDSQRHASVAKPESEAESARTEDAALEVLERKPSESVVDLAVTPESAVGVGAGTTKPSDLVEIQDASTTPAESPRDRLERLYATYQASLKESQVIRQYQAAHALLGQCVVASLDDQGRGTDTYGEPIRVKALAPGQVSIGSNGKHYLFQAAEFPEYAAVQAQVKRYVQQQMEDAQVDPLTDELVAQIDARLAETLALLDRGN